MTTEPRTAWHRVSFGKMASAAAVIIFKDTFRDSPDGPVAKTLCSNAGGLASILGQGTKETECGKEDERSQMPQLRPGAAKYIFYKFCPPPPHPNRDHFSSNFDDIIKIFQTSKNRK